MFISVYLWFPPLCPGRYNVAMSGLSWLTGGVARVDGNSRANTEHIQVHYPLRRVLAFLGYSIDDVCNNPIVRNEVMGYYAVYREIERSGEITDLEQQWNGLE